MNVHGMILAGGKGLRLGAGPKGLALIFDRPMSAYVHDTLSENSNPIGLNTIPEYAEAYAKLGLPLILDDGALAGYGPLAGILAGLEWAHKNAGSILLTAPCDAPYLPKTLGAQLLGALNGRFDATIARTPSGIQPLCAAWRTDLATALRMHLSAPSAKLAVRAFLAKIHVREVVFENDDQFLNINTPDDMQTAITRQG